MQVILLIDTSDNKQIKVGLVIDGKKHLIDQTIDHNKAQIVLPLIEKLLKEHGLKVDEISAITVNPGPGSFTGLRVGITIANTLAFLLQIPVNENGVGKNVEPIYEG